MAEVADDCGELFAGVPLPILMVSVVFSYHHKMSTNSSPSLYSRPASNVGHGPSPWKLSSRLRHLAEEPDDYRRLSMVAGPTLRKYADNPWDGEVVSRSSTTTISSAVGDFGRSATKIVKGMRSTSAGPRSRSTTRSRKEREMSLVETQTSVSSQYALSSIASTETHMVPDGQARRAMYESTTKSVGGVLHHAQPTSSSRSSSNSALSSEGPVLCTPQQSAGAAELESQPSPSQQKRMAQIVQAKLLAAFDDGSEAGLHLISLEVARERERVQGRLGEPARDTQTRGEHAPRVSDVSSPSPQKLRGKKSGLMRMFNRTPARSGGRPRRPSVSSENRSSRTGSMWSDNGEGYPKFQDEIGAATIASVKPQLELRPMSMSFRLPADYLAQEATADSSSGEKEFDDSMQFANARKAWQMQVYELEAQIRELRDELEEGRTNRTCHVCARDKTPNERLAVPGGVMDRVRVKTAGARGVFGSGSLYEWHA